MTYWCIYYNNSTYVQNTLCEQYAYIVFKFPTKFQLIKYQHFTIHILNDLFFSLKIIRL